MLLTKVFDDGTGIEFLPRVERQDRTWIATDVRKDEFGVAIPFSRYCIAWPGILHVELTEEFNLFGG
jgi:hypothetical protein